MLSDVLLQRFDVHNVQVDEQLETFVPLDNLVSFNSHKQLVVLINISREENCTFRGDSVFGVVLDKHFDQPVCQIEQKAHSILLVVFVFLQNGDKGLQKVNKLHARCGVSLLLILKFFNVKIILFLIFAQDVRCLLHNVL